MLALFYRRPHPRGRHRRRRPPLPLRGKPITRRAVVLQVLSLDIIGIPAPCPLSDVTATEFVDKVRTDPAYAKVQSALNLLLTPAVHLMDDGTGIWQLFRCHR